MQGIRIVQLKLSRHISKINFNLHCFIYESYRRGPHQFPQANVETNFLLPIFICYKQFLGCMARKCTLSNHLQNYFVLYFKPKVLNVLSARGSTYQYFVESRWLLQNDELPGVWRVLKPRIFRQLDVWGQHQARPVRHCRHKYYWGNTIQHSNCLFKYVIIL